MNTGEGTHAKTSGQARAPAPTKCADADELVCQVGDRVGQDFVIQGLIGCGGIGQVYRARHETMHRDAAVKVLATCHRDRPDVVQRFLSEGRALAELRHPSIVEIYHAGRDPIVGHFIAMELLLGKNLRQVMTWVRRMSIEQALGLVIALCEALRAMHDVQLIHRDVKPENLILHHRPGQPLMVKLIDLGGAHVPPKYEQHTSQEKLVFGTAAYMSPEHVRGDKTSPASDLYSHRRDALRDARRAPAVWKGPPRRAHPGRLLELAAPRGAHPSDQAHPGISRACVARHRARPRERSRRAMGLGERAQRRAQRFAEPLSRGAERQEGAAGAAGSGADAGAADAGAADAGAGRRGLDRVRRQGHRRRRNEAAFGATPARRGRRRHGAEPRHADRPGRAGQMPARDAAAPSATASPRWLVTEPMATAPQRIARVAARATQRTEPMPTNATGTGTGTETETGAEAEAGAAAGAATAAAAAMATAPMMIAPPATARPMRPELRRLGPLEGADRAHGRREPDDDVRA